MTLADMLGRRSVQKGIDARYDRRHRFHLQRLQDAHGLHVYALTNQARGQRVHIPRYLFDRFRAAVRQAARTTPPAAEEQNDFLVDIYFKTRPRFSFAPNKSVPGELLIRELESENGPPGYLSVAWQALATLDSLLYHPALRHPSDLLERIIAYHKLFQFSFTASSESITSDLIMRKDVLSEVDRYHPSLGMRVSDQAREASAEQEPPPAATPPQVGRGRAGAGQFKSRLAEKQGEQAYQVDYAALFGRMDDEKSAVKVPQSPAAQPSRRGPVNISDRCVTLPLVANDIKAFSTQQFRCEFTADEIQTLRRDFLADRDADIYLGFEILDCVFRKSGQLHTFRFPLYYFPVTLTESGRQIIVGPAEEGGRVYLNHLALANLLSSFGTATASRDPVEELFKSLLLQTFEVDNKMGRVRVVRRLPHDKAVYSHTREILLGRPGENGKGGLLADAAVQAIECDLEAVRLYRTDKPSHPLVAALESDFEHIATTAFDAPQRFYDSLLGRFLSPEASSLHPAPSPFSKSPWIPGALPKSTRKLLAGLNDHDLVLLEGPPGTGKTHTIANLVIHCIATGQRVLVVSDQQSAVQALTERLQDYILGRDRQSLEAKRLEALWRAAIKVVDEIPDDSATLPRWVAHLRRMLLVDAAKESDWPAEDPRLDDDLAATDAAIQQAKDQLAVVLADYASRQYRSDRPLGRLRQPYQSPQADEVDDVVTLVRTLRGAADGCSGEPFRGVVRTLIRDRERLHELGLACCHEELSLPDGDPERRFAALTAIHESLQHLHKSKPTNEEGLRCALEPLAGHLFAPAIRSLWEQAYAPTSWRGARAWRRFKSLFRDPLGVVLRDLQRIIDNQKKLLDIKRQVQPSVWRQLQAVHDTMAPSSTGPVPLCFEICRHACRTPSADATVDQTCAQACLEDIAQLQTRRDEIVRERFMGALGAIARRALQPSERGGTNQVTAILAALDSLQPFTTLVDAQAVHRELQAKLFDAYPVWICRKRAVPFLLPCADNCFDLVVVDEATQCRVDDALPLLFRGRKLMAVGDEKQTVLAKNSVLDDYLFRDFDLDEHLRFAQAGNIKGGGSHLFGLVKRIKQASVMLDEHYRCPPEIIAFSNRYVYDDELKIMQWSMENSPPAVVVDHSERNASPSERKGSGKFRGVETDMVDRFFEYVLKTLRSIERTTAERINVETDAALCYFLLKNEPYVKKAKGDFLRRLRRGSDILDGAGAALQGKERRYIFYLWDITRSNIAAFRQGDDPAKRKGELNVLMSRPKQRAYHFLHRDFADLDHRSASIADYLWRTLAQQDADGTDDDGDLPDVPSRTCSASMIEAVLDETLGGCGNAVATALGHAQEGVIVGDPRHVVDVVYVPGPDAQRRLCTGVIDLGRFATSTVGVDDACDYFFQLQRAVPCVYPVFAFVHELAAPDETLALRRIREGLSE